MKVARFTIPGMPHVYVAKVCINSREYTPAKAAFYNACITIENAYNQEKMKRPVSVDIIFYFKAPSTRPERLKRGPTAHDNPPIGTLLRFVEDILHKYVLERLGLINEVCMLKRFDSNPRTEIIIKELV